MNEPQTRLDLIDPAIRTAGWTAANGCRMLVDACAPFGFAVGESPLRSVASAAHLLSMPSCTTTNPKPTASAPNSYA